jgi:hypothetical protein
MSGDAAGESYAKRNRICSKNRQWRTGLAVNEGLVAFVFQHPFDVRDVLQNDF